MSAKEVSEALQSHGFSVPDLYPDRVYDDSHDEGYDSAWDLHTVHSTFKQILFSVFMSQCRWIKLETKYTHVLECMVTIVYLFVEICLLFALSNMIVLWRKLFSQKSFSKNGMTMRNPKKIWKKRVGKGQVVQPNGTSWDKLEYVGQVGQGEGGLQIYVGQVGQGEGGLQIFVGQVGQVGQGQGVCKRCG